MPRKKKTKPEGFLPEKGDEPRWLCFPTGSTLLNLAVSDHADGGYGAGKGVNLVGDSDSGKTLLVLSGYMEMSLDPKWDEYRLIYDDAEDALEMAIDEMFGPKLAKRLEDPFGNRWGDDEFRSSENIEEFKNNVMMALATVEKEGPFVYTLDSYDGLTSREETKRQKKEAGGKEQKRDYPRQPAILNEMFRSISSKMRDTQSLVIIVSQTRDAINPGTFAATKRRAGGRGLKFFSSHEVWLAITGQIKRSINERDRSIGSKVRARSHRSKLTGKRRDVELKIYDDYGVDDVGSMIDWLVENKIWNQKPKSTTIDTNGWVKKPMTRAKIVELVERGDGDWLGALRDECQDAWNTIEECLKMDRPRRWEV